MGEHLPELHLGRSGGLAAASTPCYEDEYCTKTSLIDKFEHRLRHTEIPVECLSLDSSGWIGNKSHPTPEI